MLSEKKNTNKLKIYFLFLNNYYWPKTQMRLFCKADAETLGP